MTEPENKEEFATIETIVTDQGNGSSSCSACGANIDIFKLSSTKRCPNPECNRLLGWGDTYINSGGSDF